MTNLGALTTTFTPAPKCTSIISGIVHTETITINCATTTTTYEYQSLGPENTTPCFPSGFRVASDMFYSPGVCPQGWSSACGSFEIVGTITETRATCCPYGYTCMTPPPLAVPWSTLSCITDARSVVNVTVSDASNQRSKVIQLQPVINVAAVNVRWQQSDFAVETSDSTSSSSTPPSSSLPFWTGPSLQASSPDPDDVGLPTNLKIGIGVGAGLGGLVLSGAVIFCIWHVRRRKHRRAGGEGPSEKPPPNDYDPILKELEVPRDAWPQPAPEMRRAHNPREMMTSALTHELNDSAGVSTQRPFSRPVWAYVHGHTRNSSNARISPDLPQGRRDKST